MDECKTVTGPADVILVPEWPIEDEPERPLACDDADVRPHSIVISPAMEPPAIETAPGPAVGQAEVVLPVWNQYLPPPVVRPKN